MATLKFLAYVSMLIKNPGGKRGRGGGWPSVMKSEKLTKPCKSFKCWVFIFYLTHYVFTVFKDIPNIVYQI